MFDSLSDRLGGVFDKLRGRGALREQDVRDAISAILDNTSLADMSARSSRAEPVLVYDI